MTSSTGGEFRGKNVDAAIEAGLAELGLKVNQVTIEVLSKGSRGLLGFGAEDARVRITPIAEPGSKPAAVKPAPAPKPQPRPAPPPPAAIEKKAKPQPPAPTARPQPTPAAGPQPAPAAAEEAEPDVEAVAGELLQGMLDRMGIRATVQVVAPDDTPQEPGRDAPLVLNIEGDDLGILIGRQGETLAAVQYLLRLMVNHRMHRWTNLVVDVEGYKARREEQLRNMARRMAEQVVSTGRAVALEPMPARERRIIHITLRDHAQVATQSVGEGESRKVTIIPKS